MKTILVGVALALLASPAIAESGDRRRDVRVSIADLDLATPDGVAALDQRLAKAVLKVCGTAYFLDQAQLDDVDRCRVDAGARAVALRQQVLDRKEGGVVPGSRAL
jgi:UrcA family protein